LKARLGKQFRKKLTVFYIHIDRKKRECFSHLLVGVSIGGLYWATATPQLAKYLVLEKTSQYTAKTDKYTTPLLPDSARLETE